MDRGLVVLGGSGHAAVVIATARAAGFSVQAVYDDDEKLHGTNVLGVPIVGPIPETATDGERAAVIAIGSNTSRRAVAGRVSIPLATIVHPSASTSEELSIGEGTVVFAGATIQPRTTIGDHVIVNTGAIIDHDCTVGDFVHIAPGVTVCGGVAVGDDTFLGAGATVLPGVRIGAGATVGAGAVVLEDVPSGATVVGVPARPLGQR